MTFSETSESERERERERSEIKRGRKKERERDRERRKESKKERERERKKERKKESPSPRPPISYPASAGFIGSFYQKFKSTNNQCPLLEGSVWSSASWALADKKIKHTYCPTSGG